MTTKNDNGQKAETEERTEKAGFDQSRRELEALAEEENISMIDQLALSEQIAGESDIFSELGEEAASEVLMKLKLNGVEFWLERATKIHGKEPDEQAAAGASNPETLPEVRSMEPEATGGPLKIYDEEAGEFMEVSREQQHLANGLQQRLDMATLLTALIMKKMADDKLYRAVDKGYSSFREYAELRCPFSYRHAQKYAAIGRKFAPIFPEVGSGGGIMTPDSKALNGDFGKLGELGMTKLYELSKIEEADFSEVLSKEKVTLADGTELDLEELKSKSVREFHKQLEEHRQYIEDQEAEINTLAWERDEAWEAKQQAEKQAEIGRKYKDMYGQKSDQYEVFKNRIGTARMQAADLNQSLSKIKDMPAEFEELIAQLQGLHRDIDRGLQSLRADNIESGAFATFDR